MTVFEIIPVHSPRVSSYPTIHEQEKPPSWLKQTAREEHGFDWHSLISEWKEISVLPIHNVFTQLMGIPRN